MGTMSESLVSAGLAVGAAEVLAQNLQARGTGPEIGYVELAAITAQAAAKKWLIRISAIALLDGMFQYICASRRISGLFILTLVEPSGFADCCEPPRLHSAMTTIRGLPESTQFLDPTRGGRPIFGAVNIPLAELPDRLHELPEKSRTIYVVGEGDDVEQALQYLRGGGRRAERGEDWKYADEPLALRMWSPNEFLCTVLAQLKPRSATDIACGAGREAVAMAALGWTVNALDWQEEALMRGQQLATRYAPEVASEILWQLTDIERPSYQPPPSDLITAFRYLHRPLIPKLIDALNPGGSLVMETFTTLHREKYGKPRSDGYVLIPGEFVRLAGDLDVVHYSEDWREDSHTARIWLRKR